MAKVNPNPKAVLKKGRKTSSPTTTPQRDTIERQIMIAEAAYFIAEQRGFTAGEELNDWLQAEREIQPSLRQQ